MATQKTGAAPLPTGKGRATRIPLDYFKHLNGMEKAKLGMTAVAVLLTVGWLVWGAVAEPNGGSMRYSRGPVAKAHEKWDSDCMQCHSAFSPISEQNLFMSHPAASDKKCQDCHTTPENMAKYHLATADHYESRDPASNKLFSCGACHREHQGRGEMGRDNYLIRLPDSDCTSCHKDLKHHFKSGAPIAYANEVSSFAKHPEFGNYAGLPLKDTGKLKFNHKLHMTPGQVNSSDSLGGYTLGKIQSLDAKAADGFKNAKWQNDKGPDALVTLDCASCHVPQSAKEGSPNAKQSDWYMQPIQYEAHCKACHPLTFDAKIKKDGKPFPLPHGIPLTAIDGLLRDAYKDFQITPRQPISRPLPGKLPSPDTAPRTVDDLVKEASRYIKDTRAGCMECHFVENNTIAQPNVPAVWFKHANFNHKAHLDPVAKCVDCHSGATTSIDHADVLIPDLKKCQSCHSATPAPGLKAGRFDCTECHNFHQRGNPHVGAIARERDPLLALEWRSLLPKKGK